MSQAKVTKAIRDGIETSYSNTATEWRKAAHEALDHIARNNQFIVSDMLIAVLEDRGLALNNYSALGGVFTRAARDKLIVKTGNAKVSTRAKSHSSKTVWRSLVYKVETGGNTESNVMAGLIINALNYNAGVIQHASLIYGSGGLKQSAFKHSIQHFKRMSKDYMKKHDDILATVSGGPKQ